MEVTPRFELGSEGFADLCLTTWLCHLNGETKYTTFFLARQVFFYEIIDRNSSSEMMRTPSDSAFVSLLPAFSPATTMLVFFDTLEAAFPP